MGKLVNRLSLSQREKTILHKDQVTEGWCSDLKRGIQNYRYIVGMPLHMYIWMQPEKYDLL